MIKRTAIILAALLAGAAASAQSPLWLRKNAISPDGKTIAFTYKGNLFTVPSQGGKAAQLTSNAAYESDPVWSRDGKSIYFSSWRDGNKDVYVTSPEGGAPRRLTDYPGNETPMAALRDGSLVISASIQQDPSYGGFPVGTQLYIIGSEGAPKQLTTLPVSAISAGEGIFLYEDYKGYEDAFRKHHTSSVTRDIWLCRTSNGLIDKNSAFTKLTSFQGEDRNPVLGADGKTFWWLSEQNGKTINVFRSSIDNPGQSVQLTFAEKDPVRYLSVSDDGLLVFSLNGELYTLREGEQPKKLEISILTDQGERPLTKMELAGGATAMSVSPDEKEIAIVVRGDVFVTAADYSTTRRITNTACQERNVCFSPDGREIYYSSERNGCWGIYRTVLCDKKDKLFTYATAIKEELVSDEGETCFQPAVSPDGKKVAYLRDRTEIVVKPTGGGKAKSLLKDANYSYSDGDQYFSWSPDSRFILTEYQADGGWNNTDVAMIDVESGQITDLTRSGYSDGSFRWALDGHAMTWQSDKNGYRSHGSWGATEDIYIMFFDPARMQLFRRDKEDEELAGLLEGKKDEKKDSTDKKKPEKLKFDLEGRDSRILRLTKASTHYGDHYLSPDGKKLYYITPLESGSGLCELDIRKGDVKVLQRNVFGRIIPSADGKNIYIFSGRGITRIATSGAKTDAISFSGEFDFKPAEEREYMFEHVWKQVKEKFYDPGLHGAPWDYCHENYRRFLPHIDNYFDFQEMLSEMLGELNGSHTGARYRPAAEQRPSYIGVLLDPAWSGDGLKIAEVLPEGVLAVADPEIKAGDIIKAIEGQEIKAGDNWYSLLGGKAGKKIQVTVKKGGKTVNLIVKPVASESDLMYRRWVRQREQMVEKLSGGRIGYVHVEGMDSESFREVYSKALGRYRNCDALIVDTRHNGGGWLHDDLATFLSGKAYVTFTPRGQYMGTEPYNKWTKPSCVLVGEDNYSDASAFPIVYRDLGIGKIIGAPVPGTMTAVWWETLINPAMVFGIPQVGCFGLKEGRYLENLQLEPDILVLNDPASELAGKDRQLEIAVKEMLKETGNGQ